MATGSVTGAAVVHDRPRPAWGPIGAGALCLGVLAAGWRARDAYWIAPDAGLGYALGPLGLGLMALLLGYSLRKRWRALGQAGSIRTWFHVHMVLGLLGPTAILLHANFALGSTNARVALACMLAVAGSGLVGRFVYTRIHYEAFGRKARIVELRRATVEGRNRLGQLAGSSRAVAEAMERFERTAFEGADGVWGSFAQALRARPAARRLRRVARRHRGATRDAANRRAALRELRSYVRAGLRVADYAFCERVFALWHAIHLPLCVLLFASAAVHVVAVHRY
jgi:hypothetical protein